MNIYNSLNPSCSAQIFLVTQFNAALLAPYATCFGAPNDALSIEPDVLEIGTNFGASVDAFNKGHAA
jgi:hypothetical protein